MKRKTWWKGKVTIKKQSNLTQDELVNVARDEMNKVDKINDSVNTALDTVSPRQPQVSS